MKKLRPRMYVSSIQDIRPYQLRSMGIKGLIIDLDNTIVPWQSNEIPAEGISWLKDMKNAGIGLCIVSNAKAKRVSTVTGPLKIWAISKAIKPRTKAFKKAMELMSTQVGETAVIGDQIFTDILGGNRLGLYTILVLPLSNKEFFGTKIVRQLEKVVLQREIKRLSK